MSNSRLNHECEERIPFISDFSPDSSPNSEQTLELRVRNSPLPPELQRKSSSDELKRKRLVRTHSDVTVEYMDHEIKSGETLQGLSLLYRIPVFELKRQNNIDKDNEFFARRSLRIPVKIHSLLTENHKVVPTANLIDLNDESEKLDDDANQVQSGEAFLAHVDQDLERLKKQSSLWDSPNAHSSQAAVWPREPPPRRQSDCGDECGLSWLQVMGLALTVLLICPLLYFLYIELGKPETITRFFGITNQSEGAKLVPKQSISSNT